MTPLFSTVSFCFIICAILPKASDQCAATTVTTTPTPTTTGCQSCTLDQITILRISTGNKAFESDTIDTSGTCAVRTSVCVGNTAADGVIISYNQDAAGVTPGTGTATSVLTCNDQGQWIKTENGATEVITELECQST